MQLRNLVLMLVTLMLPALLVGCSSGGPGKYDVNVALDQSVTGGVVVPSIAVNIIAAGGPEAQRLSGMSMTKYWQPDSAERRELAPKTKEFTFGPGKTGEQRLLKNDPIWDAWKGADTLFIFANLPGGHTDAPGNMDNRRVELTLDKSRWETGQILQILVARSKVSCLTPMKPEKK